MPSFFEPIDFLPEDPILNIPIIFAKDPHPKKVNLGIGVYENSEGASNVLSAVKKAENLLNEQSLLKDYLPIDGDVKYLQHVYKLVFGAHSAIPEENVYASQSIGGTGSLAIAAAFLKTQEITQIALSDPSWPNHILIFDKAELKISLYPYQGENKQLNFSGMCSALEALPSRSAVLLHACCHNPTGIDPTLAQWKELSEIIKRKKILPYFDLAYQGLGDNLEKDVEALRYFANQNHEMVVSVSFSKNLGLYGERVGALFIIAHHEETKRKVATHIKQIVRSQYSNPPLHGVRIVSKVLESPELTAEWQQELSGMCKRVKEMRQLLQQGLMSHQTRHDFSYITSHKGFFSCLNLDLNQINTLRSEHGVYLLDNGRINIAGLNEKNIDYVVASIIKVMK